ncbi:SDR family NAD(P)-dependent oxidoreductase [Glaciihabitans sp. dw_435]|uniref:SDR family NAD(P)-dependent oxidoreductase n=1 Tax=Glaciihabitans sp. dw_435 TaxID=2720081 RepID=UPI001BD45335|nr:SDR family NAD(P)-dependent oxidoreductase [Glaciihabitans sp. dw_435]
MTKTIVITGASDGIGAAAAAQLNRLGHEVVVIGRSREKTRQVASSIGADHFTADFSDLRTVRELAETLQSRYPRIDVLANNAGGVFGTRDKTLDGHEKTFQVNQLAPFLLTSLLMPILVNSNATIIQTASIAARLYGNIDITDLENDRRYSANKAYGDSKLENILFTKELDRRYRSDGISAVAFHPGVIRSSFAAETTSFGMKFLYANPLTKRFLSTADEGAEQLVWLATTSPGLGWHPGAYYEKHQIATRVNPQSDDENLALELWHQSAALVGV